MASGIFAILDDIAALMDDVAVTSKVAANKTAAILGDDLAVNAEKATGFVSSREIPVLWAITKGSLINKLIIVPITLLLNVFLPDLIGYILILGGFYLAFEGVEKVIEVLFHKKHEDTKSRMLENDPAAEKAKINAAVTTDFILSIEIVIIALNTVLDQSLMIQIFTVSLIAVLATVGVYGIVTLIVRMDDVGYKLIRKSKGEGILFPLGKGLVRSLPVVIKVLGYVGTVALFMVAGGIFEHNVGFLHGVWDNIPGFLRQILFATIAGLIVVILVTGFKSLYRTVVKK